jgi:hypothetical protein
MPIDFVLTGKVGIAGSPLWYIFDIISRLDWHYHVQYYHNAHEACLSNCTKQFYATVLVSINLPNQAGRTTQFGTWYIVRKLHYWNLPLLFKDTTPNIWLKLLHFSEGIQVEKTHQSKSSSPFWPKASHDINMHLFFWGLILWYSGF